jgi:hypothetical protein
MTSDMRTLRFSLAAVSLLGGFTASLVRAGDTPALPAPEIVQPGHAEDGSLPQVTIEAERRLERQVYDFVRTLSRQAARDEALKRWQQPVCPLVAGLPGSQGEFVLTRISGVARTAGAPLAPQECRPNLYVVVTASPDKLLSLWQQRHRRLFGGASPTEVRDFLTKPRPVRVWYNVSFGTNFGTQLDQGAPELGTVYNNAPANHHFSGSRLVIDDVPLFSSVIVVVDVVQVSGLQYGQLADYIAMIALAQLDLDVQPSAPSILQLFAPDTPDTPKPDGLSSWDTAFLKALYSTKQGTTMQRSSIATSMLHTMATP